MIHEKADAMPIRSNHQRPAFRLKEPELLYNGLIDPQDASEDGSFRFPHGGCWKDIFNRLYNTYLAKRPPNILLNMILWTKTPRSHESTDYPPSLAEVSSVSTLKARSSCNPVKKIENIN